MIVVRLIALVAAGGFGYAAYLQHNDPDWRRWVAVYAAACAVCLLIALKKFVKIAKLGAAMIALAALGWAGYLAIGVLRAREFTMNEVERETLGLVIVGAVMLALIFAGRSKKPKPAPKRES